MKRVGIAAATLGVVILGAACSTSDSPASRTTSAAPVPDVTYSAEVAPESEPPVPVAPTGEPVAVATTNVATVKITTCTVDPERGALFAGTVTNTNKGPTPRYLWVSVEFLDANGDRVDESVAQAAYVKTGQSVPIEGNGLQNPTALPPNVSCGIMSVDREE